MCQRSCGEAGANRSTKGGGRTETERGRSGYGTWRPLSWWIDAIPVQRPDGRVAVAGVRHLACGIRSNHGGESAQVVRAEGCKAPWRPRPVPGPRRQWRRACMGRGLQPTATIWALGPATKAQLLSPAQPPSRVRVLLKARLPKQRAALALLQPSAPAGATARRTHPPLTRPRRPRGS